MVAVKAGIARENTLRRNMSDHRDERGFRSSDTALQHHFAISLIKWRRLDNCELKSAYISTGKASLHSIEQPSFILLLVSILFTFLRLDVVSLFTILYNLRTSSLVPSSSISLTIPNPS